MRAHLRFYRRDTSQYLTSPTPDPPRHDTSEIRFDSSSAPPTASSSFAPMSRPDGPSTAGAGDARHDQRWPSAPSPRDTWLRSNFGGGKKSSFIGGVARHNCYHRETQTSLRPEPATLTTEPLASSAVAAAPEAAKSRKSLPFLRQSVSSLLMRRRTSHNLPEINPLHLASPQEPSYDPRIRGTKVHDFSTPRSRVPEPTNANMAPAPTPAPPPEPLLNLAASHDDEDNDNANHTSHQLLPLVVQSSGVPFDSRRGPTPEPVPPDAMRATSPSPPAAIDAPAHMASPSYNPLQRLPSTQRPGDISTMCQPQSPSSPPASGGDDDDADDPSRDIFLPRASASTIPKHMASKSSRFSFDVIGAATQEKMLEEKHRELGYDKPSSPTTTSDGGLQDMIVEDSPYDNEFSEEMDYDDMMDDEAGLEERIPGINCDLDEADPACDNAKESPRHGDVAREPQPRSPEPVGLVSLGIMGLDVAPPAQYDVTTFRENRDGARTTLPLTSDAATDDIYFDDGLADELSFPPDDEAIDESIFDNDDVDQYNRPIPGSFARAKEAMMAARQRGRPLSFEPDASATAVTTTATTNPLASSEPSDSSHVSRSTSATLVSSTGQLCDMEWNPAGLKVAGSIVPAPSDIAWQAALAEAAQKAASEGRFRQDCSPSVSPKSDSQLAAECGRPQSGSSLPPRQQDLESQLLSYLDSSPANASLDDNYDCDDGDDDIIAAANASALANDSDGFYGQEFGFYAAPPIHGHHHRSTTASSSASASSSTLAQLSTANLYEYANGGYFGEPCIDGIRSLTSGRVVSHEPNLTPITERSEYSNRNSVMSVAQPSGAFARDTTSLQSPALAQLALMDDDNPNSNNPSMNLSALIRLRSKAFGGSQTSLVSSRDGSPRSDRGLGYDLPTSPPPPAHLSPSPLRPDAPHGWGRPSVPRPIASSPLPSESSPPLAARPWPPLSLSTAPTTSLVSDSAGAP